VCVCVCGGACACALADPECVLRWTGATTCSLDQLNWGSAYDFRCFITPPQSAQTLSYPLPILVSLLQRDRVIGPTQPKFNTFTWRTTPPCSVTPSNPNTLTHSHALSFQLAHKHGC
jgi:hypothetical protein